MTLETQEVEVTDSETYQGWTNRETWAFYMYVGNDQGLYTAFREVVRREDREREVWEIEGLVKDLADTYFTPDGYYAEFGDSLANSRTFKMAFDIGSLWRVNFSEVTAALLEA